MIAVSDVLKEVAEALGVCEDDHATIFGRLNLAVKLLAQKGEWDPLHAEVRVSVTSRCFALPRDVGTVLGVVLDGRPALGKDRYFDYHINGPGETDAERLEWTAVGTFPTFFEFETPCKIGYSYFDSSDIVGNKAISLVGVDDSGGLVSNIDLPPNSMGASLGSGTYLRVDRLWKPVTRGAVEVKAYPVSGADAFTIAILEGPDTESRFVRLHIGRDAEFVRVAYRRRVFRITSVNDVIPLHSEMAILNAVKAVRHYLADDPELAKTYEQEATRMLTEQEFFATESVGRPIQVSGLNHIHDKSDELS